MGLRSIWKETPFCDYTYFHDQQKQNCAQTEEVEVAENISLPSYTLWSHLSPEPCRSRGGEMCSARHETLGAAASLFQAPHIIPEFNHKRSAREGVLEVSKDQEASSASCLRQWSTLCTLGGERLRFSIQAHFHVLKLGKSSSENLWPLLQWCGKSHTKGIHRWNSAFINL